MARESKIEWTDHTWNPWQGCTKVSPGEAANPDRRQRGTIARGRGGRVF